MGISRPLKVRVYLVRRGKLRRLFKLSRTSAGLYTIGGSLPAMPQHRPDYRTYHEDGNCFDRLGGRIIDKRKKQPLSTFKGAETQFVGVYSLLTMTPTDRDDERVSMTSLDMVLDFRSQFAVELIISELRLVLPEIPGRLNRIVRVYDNVKPVITIEAFEMADNTMPVDRFPPLQTYELGKNWLLGGEGRLS